MSRAKAGAGGVATAIATVLGAAALYLWGGARPGGRARQRARRVGPIRKATTISLTTERAYRFWRDLRNLPFFMERLDSVEMLDPFRSRWRVRGQMGRTLEWETRIVEDRENELIRWASVEGAPIANRGQVRFRPLPGDRGTEISVEFECVPPVGEPDSASSAWAAGLELQVERDLGCLKRIIEVGEVMHESAAARRDIHAEGP
jgi:uncharacterized membrane protein